MGITYEKAILMLAEEIGEINTELNKSNEKIAELEKQVKFLTRGNFKPFHPTKR